MPTLRSQLLTDLLPALRAGIRLTRLRPPFADDALQEGLIALVPHLDRLSASAGPDRTAYVLRVGIRTGMSIRKRAGRELSLGTSQEAQAWERDAARRSITPEEILRASEGARRAAEVLEALDSEERGVLFAINEDELSERETAVKTGVPLGSVGYRLRQARDVMARAVLGTTSWIGRKRRG